MKDQGIRSRLGRACLAGVPQQHRNRSDPDVQAVRAHCGVHEPALVGENERHPLAGLLDLVGELVAAYESRTHAVPDAPPREVLRLLMESSPGSTPLREILVLDEADRTSGRVKEKAVPALFGLVGRKVA